MVDLTPPTDPRKRANRRGVTSAPYLRTGNSQVPIPSVELSSKANGTLGILAIFLAGLQAQLLSILPSEDNPPVHDVLIAVLFFLGVFLDIFATLYTIFATVAFNSAFSWPVENAFDTPRIDIDSKSGRAKQWRSSLPSGFAHAQVRQAVFYYRMSYVSLGPGIICTVFGIEIYVWYHQPRAVAYALTVVCAIFVFSMLNVLIMWNWTQYKHDDGTLFEYNAAYAMVNAGTSLARTGRTVRQAWGFEPQQRMQTRSPQAEVEGGVQAVESV